MRKCPCASGGEAVMSEVTIKDIARLCGVGVSTVSRAIAAGYSCSASASQICSASFAVTALSFRKAAAYPARACTCALLRTAARYSKSAAHSFIYFQYRPTPFFLLYPSTSLTPRLFSHIYDSSRMRLPSSTALSADTITPS